MKIRGQLLVTLALVALVPLYVAGWVALRANEYTRTEQEDRALLVRAGEVAAAVDTFAAATLDGLRADSHLPALRRYLAADDERRALLISELVETLRNTVIKDPIHVGSAALLDRDGHVMVDTELGRVGASEADNLWFRQTVDSGLPSLAGPFFDADGATLWASVPIHDGGGRVVGVLRLRISAARLQEFVRRDQARDSGGSFSVLFDSAGVAIAHGEDGRLQGRVVYGGDPASLLRLKAERRVAADVSPSGGAPAALVDGVSWADLNGDGVNERVAVVALTTAPWRLALAEPASAYLAPYARVTTAVLALGVMVTLLIVGAAWLVSARIAKPIVQLTDAAERIGTGEQAILPIGASGEIGQLARAFAHGDLRLRESRAALESLNATLEARVQARTAELSQALERLQLAQGELIRSEKFIALGGLVAGIAHELNTPIGNSVTVASALMAQSRQLQRDVADNQLRRSTLIDYANNVSDAAGLLERNLSRAAELVASFKQVAVDRASSNRREFRVAEVMDETLLMLRPTLKLKPYQVDTRVAPDLAMDSFPGPLGQVLTNLVNNAIVHGFDGRSEGRVWIEASAEGADMVRISVRDDGIGMSEAMQRRVFDPFFTTKLGRGGSGLGMHIVHTIVTGLLGGSVELQSSEGQGTTVTLLVPKVAPPQ